MSKYDEAYESLHGDQLKDLPSLEQLQDQRRLIDDEARQVFLGRIAYGEYADEAEAMAAYDVEWWSKHHKEATAD